MQPEIAEQLRHRTKPLAIRMVNLCEALRSKPPARVIGNQLLRPGTPIGANYRAACRSRSRAEFVARLAVALKEAEETADWPELLVETGLIRADRLSGLSKEGDEPIRIFPAAGHRTQRRLADQNSKFRIQNSYDSLQ
jgi:four helix bundle protein